MAKSMESKAEGEIGMGKMNPSNRQTCPGSHRGSVVRLKADEEGWGAYPERIECPEALWLQRNGVVAIGRINP